MLSAVAAQVSVGTYQSTHQVWPRRATVIPRKVHMAPRERTGRKGRCAATVDYLWYGYVFIVGQPLFSLEK